MYILSHNWGQSIKALAQHPNVWAAKAGGRRSRRLASQPAIINWGCANNNLLTTLSRGCIILNTPTAVNVAGNKLLSLRALGDLAPPFTTDKAEAASWQTDVMVRHILRGHSGAGCEVVFAGHPLPDAPLYVKYVPKHKEFRVHVVGNQVDIVRKIADPSRTPTNWQIRSHQNGFIFAREGEITDTLRARLTSTALSALSALGLDFGAVDIVLTRGRKLFVLEANTAPGLVGTTVQTYLNGLRFLYERVVLNEM